MKTIHKFLALALLTAVIPMMVLGCTGGVEVSQGRDQPGSWWIIWKAEWFLDVLFVFVIRVLLREFKAGMDYKSFETPTKILFCVGSGFIGMAFIYFLVLGTLFIVETSANIPFFPTTILFFISFFYMLEFDPEAFGNIVVDTFLLAALNVLAAILLTTGILATLKGYKQLDPHTYVLVSLGISTAIRMIKWVQQG